MSTRITQALLAALLLLAAMPARASPEQPLNERIALAGAANLTDLVSQHERALVVFCVQVCPLRGLRGRCCAAAELADLILGLPARALPQSIQCRQFRENELNALPEALDAAGMSNIGVLYVDANEEEEVVQEYHLPRVPFALLLGGDKPVAHAGGFVVESLISFMRYELGMEATSPAKLLGPAGAVQWVFWRGTGSGELMPTVVALFRDLDDERTRADHEEFVKVARSIERDFRLGEGHGPEMMAAFGMPAEVKSALVMYRDFDERKVVLQGPFNGAELLTSVQRHTIPMVSFVDHTTLRRLQRLGHVLVHVMVPPLGAQKREKLGMYYQRRLTNVSQAILAEGVADRGNFTLAISDGVKYASWMKALDLEDAPLPALALVDNRNGGDAHYVYGSVAKESVQNATLEFVRQFFAGNLQPMPSHEDRMPPADALQQLARGSHKEEL